MGQLPFSTSEDQLRQLFTDNEIGGSVSSCVLFFRSATNPYDERKGNQ